MSFKKKQVQRHMYSACRVSHLSCITCGKEYRDESWKSHDGSCETIEAENRRTFGKFHKAKASKGNMFQPGKKVQHMYKGKWYEGVLVQNTDAGQWKIDLKWIDQTVYAKQHLIRKPRGKSAQEVLGLIPPDELEKLLLERDMKQNPQKYRKKEETPVDKKETLPEKVKKKKRKAQNTDDPAETPTKRRKKNKTSASKTKADVKEVKKVRVKELKKVWKRLIESNSGSLTLKQLLKETKKQFGKESQIVL